MFVVEGEDVDPTGEVLHSREVTGAAQPDVGTDTGGAVGGTDGEHPQVNPKGDRRLLGHARQLTGSDHPDDRHTRR